MDLGLFSDLVQPGVAILIGKSRSGRTRLALQLAAVQHPYGDILFFSNEQELEQLMDAFTEMEANGITQVGQFAVQRAPSFITLTSTFNESHIALMERWMTTVPKPQLIVIDQLRLEVEGDYEKALAAVMRGLKNMVDAQQHLSFSILAVVTQVPGVTPRVLALADQLLTIAVDPSRERRLTSITHDGKQHFRAKVDSHWMPSIN